MLFIIALPSVFLFLCMVCIVLIVFKKYTIAREEQKIVDIFLQKITKIPALIQVMRKYADDERIFTDTI